ncbi:hypothetical protein SPHINGO8BC_70169 [Sphingobacterium multivorum]|uniref:Uncharacterized protein n=1 Tax=Sphingobacterium multivorum TaxID=28454 RepID=A0A654DN85_SPHMU|nr:hypothetical protein SPHINGO8BC_70169 [Sphingobacterium multivorum]
MFEIWLIAFTIRWILIHIRNSWLIRFKSFKKASEDAYNDKFRVA